MHSGEFQSDLNGSLDSQVQRQVSAPRLYMQGQLQWAMAGRNREKVEAVRAELAQSAPSAAQINVVIADVDDPASLQRMVSSTDVLISMVGPYARYGKAVVSVRPQETTCRPTCAHAADAAHACSLPHAQSFVTVHQHDITSSFVDVQEHNGDLRLCPHGCRLTMRSAECTLAWTPTYQRSQPLNLSVPSCPGDLYQQVHLDHRLYPGGKRN